MSNNINILSIDVEDYFQINAFSDVIKYEDWDLFESRVEKNTIKILDLLDLVARSQETRDRGKEEARRQETEARDQPASPRGFAVPGKSDIGGQGSESEILNLGSSTARATFFILGWIAERYPDLVKEIHTRGHEVACHGYAHQLIFKQDRETFKDDVKRAKEILEDITGEGVIGYRAPTYTITKRTMWALEVLYDLGFKYDSSIFPINHDVYGWPESPRFPYYVVLNDNSSYEFVENSDHQDTKYSEKKIREFPVSTFRFFKKNIPVGGGGYFRLFPYLITKTLLKMINSRERKPFVFYLHPWEIDSGIPKMREASVLSRFRTYVNLDKTLERLERLIMDFNFTCFKDIL